MTSERLPQLPCHCSCWVGGQRGTAGCRVVLHRTARAAAFPEGTALVNTSTQPSTCPCNQGSLPPAPGFSARAMPPTNTKAGKLERLESFLGRLLTSQFTLNGFVWAERRGLGLPGNANAFYVNPTHTWPIFCCSERTVTIYLIQTRQLLGYIWTS